MDVLNCSLREENMMEEMKFKFGCYQSSGTAVLLYKIDEEGHQSTFNAFVSPETDGQEKKEIIVIVDNDQIKKETFWGTQGLTVGDAFNEYGKWASDAPYDFDLQAKRDLGNLLRSELRTTDITTETKVAVKADTKGLGVEASHKKKKELKNKKLSTTKLIDNDWHKICVVSRINFLLIF